MKKLVLPILLIAFTITLAQTPCNGGMAGVYPCNGYDLQSRVTLNDMNAGGGNDSWGWTDPSNGDEYAIMALNNGTAFIDITDPVNPIYLGKLPTHTSNSSWRDVKVYNNHAFVVSEANGHGMQVFDLTRLRSVTSPPQTFTEDAHFDGFGSAHNIVINEDTGYAYPVGANRSVFPFGGPIFINIQDPVNPVSEGGYGMDSYSHDAQIITYCGPDLDYVGREILIGSNEDEIVIADITDKSNPQSISSISYSNVGYTHQGWFTEDQRFFILGDELDEQDFGFNTRTVIFDFQDLDNPQFSFNYTGPSPAIDHNGYVKGTKYYMANYRAGLRVIDVSDIANSNISEEGFFDTYPNNNNANFSGAWNVYPYFESGNIVISDINRGLFIVKASNGDTTPPVASCNDFTVELGTDGTATIAPADINNNSTDDSGSVNLILCETTFNCSDIGSRTVDLEVYDAFGNRDICTSTLTIVDNLDPVLDCPSDISVAYDNDQNFYTVPSFENDGVVTITDNCLSIDVSQTPVVNSQLTEGDYTVQFSATDGSGNTSNCSFTLRVRPILGTNNVAFESGLSIYPNPSSDIVTIKSASEAISSITISDVTGKILFTENNLDAFSKTIDIATYSKGLYFLNINEKASKKIIKN